VKAWILLFVAVPAAAFALGVIRSPDLGPAEGTSASISNPPVLVHSGIALSTARNRFAAVQVRSFAPPVASGEPQLGEPIPFAENAFPPPEPPPEPFVPPPPPPVDIADRFSGDLTAVVRGAQGPTLLLLEESNPAGRRAVRRGQSYRDGWRVQEITAAEVVLRKGESERRIPIMQGRQPAPIMLARAPEPQPQQVQPEPQPGLEPGLEPIVPPSSLPPDGEVLVQPQAETETPPDGTPRPRRRITRSGQE
jgi:hypothetical protein